MWIGNLYAWIIGLFVEKAVESALETGDHQEPEESDWDWSENEDAKEELDSAGLVITTENVVPFMTRLSTQIERGFGESQIAVVENLCDNRLRSDETRYMDYHVRALGKGTPLKLLVKCFEPGIFGFFIWTDPVLIFEIEKFTGEFELRELDQQLPPEPGLN